jgi:hypothetical protein
MTKASRRHQDLGNLQQATHLIACIIAREAGARRGRPRGRAIKAEMGLRHVSIAVTPSGNNLPEYVWPPREIH